MPQAETDAEAAPFAAVEAEEILILPGESLAKYTAPTEEAEIETEDVDAVEEESAEPEGIAEPAEPEIAEPVEEIVVVEAVVEFVAEEPS